MTSQGARERSNDELRVGKRRRMSPEWDLEGRTALVTGPARGIGADTARRLHARGMNVVLAGLEPERLEKLAAELGPRSMVAACDVTSVDQLDSTVGAAIERFGGIDVVVANAGVNAIGSVEASDRETWERVIEVNLLGVVRTVRATLPHVIARRGYVLNVSSLAAVVPMALGANYTAAKHAVNGFTHALRAEVAAQEVGVGCAYFGLVDTDLVRRSSRDPATMAMLAAAPRLISKPIPVSRAGEAIARGVERRARMVYAPRWILPLLLAPGLFLPLIERGGARATNEGVNIANDRERMGKHGVKTFVDPG